MAQLRLGELVAVRTIEQLANCLDTSVKRLNHLLYSNKKPSYHEFHIPKASGSSRLITAPPSPIMAIQRKLYPALHEAYKRKTPVHGFVKGYGIKSNAKCHVDRALLLNIDLEDFFPTIHFGRVRGVFVKAPFNLDMNVASVLANLCCHSAKLPQGAPTSPIISNFVCRTLDRSLLQVAQRHGCRYTRYADDITFSSNRNEFPEEIVAKCAGSGSATLGPEIVKAIDKAGFSINQSKVRVAARTQRQEVTGLIVNRSVNVPRSFIRNLRATLFKIESAGYEATDSEFKARDFKTRSNSSPSLRNHIGGKLDYLRMVRGRGDPLHSKMLLRANRAIPDFNRPVTLLGNAALQADLIAHAVFAVVAHTGGQEHVVGTAFAVSDCELVTNDHVVAADPAYGDTTKWEVVNAADPTVRFTVISFRSRSYSDPRLPEWLDLAILDVDGELPAKLSRGVWQGDNAEVKLAGFPAAGLPGEAMSMTPGAVVRRKAEHGVGYLLTTINIIGGNSGGPVIDCQSGQVIGVGTYGLDQTIFPNSAIEIDALTHIQPLAPTPAT